MNKINTKYKEPINSVAVIFRYLSANTENMMNCISKSNFHSVITKVTGSDFYEGDPLIFPIQKAINNYIDTVLNNNNNGVVFYHDDYLQILIKDEKVYLEFGEILNKYEKDAVEVVINTYCNKYDIEALRIIIMIIDVFDRRLPMKILYYDW